MAYLTAGTALVGLLGLLDLLLTLGVIRRLREQATLPGEAPVTILPAGSEVAVVDHAGHFLQLEQPDKVAELILAFIGSPGSSS